MNIYFGFDEMNASDVIAHVSLLAPFEPLINI